MTVDGFPLVDSHHCEARVRNESRRPADNDACVSEHRPLGPSGPDTDDGDRGSRARRQNNTLMADGVFLLGAPQGIDEQIAQVPVCMFRCFPQPAVH